MGNDATKEGRIPTLHVVADSIPLAYYRAMKEVWEKGLIIRTEYDRKDSDGSYIDPPSRDARVLVEITDPFKQPRYPPVSFCEIGAYIAEMLGVKDHMVVPIDKLKEAITGELSSREWPYTYHQRLFSHPREDGSKVDQIKLVLERVAETPYTRRAVASTAIPTIDPYLKADVPCLRELQLRAPEDVNGNLITNLTTTWRSRDLYKAWADNVIAVTFLQSVFAKALEEKTGKKTKVGSYADFSYSLHIYGQDFSAVGGDKEKDLRSFFDNFDEKKIIERSMTSEMVRDMLILPQLKNLLTEEKIKEWRFPQESINLLENLVEDFEKGNYIP